ESIGTSALRAASASRKIEAGTSSARATTRSTRASNASPERPVRSTMRLRFCGLVRVATVESMWSLNANRSMRPSDRPLRVFPLGIEVVGFLAEVEAGVSGELGPHGLDRLEQQPRIVSAAKARLPRPGR